MELSFPLSHSCYPPCSSSSPHSSKRAQQAFGLPSSRSLVSHSRFRFGCFLKQPIPRHPTNHGLDHDMVCVSGSPCYPPQNSSCDERRFNITCYGCKCCKRPKFARDIAVCSELTGTGSTEASYPLSEILLNSRIRGICFYVITACSAVIFIIPMILQHPLVLMFDRYRRKAHYHIANAWASLTVAPFIKIKYQGLENLPSTDTPAVFVSNHQSFLDIYTLMTLGSSFKFISKTSIFLYPIIGWAMFLLGVIPLKCVDTKSQLDCLKECIAVIKEGASVCFFPEGTRSKDRKLRPFKKGAFSVAVKTGVPVVPITLVGTGKIMPAGMEGILNPGSVKVIIHPPVVSSDPNTVCNDARSVIAHELLLQG